MTFASHRLNLDIFLMNDINNKNYYDAVNIQLDLAEVAVWSTELYVSGLVQ